MAIRNLLVHLDQGERTPARLALAATLAQQHGARLIGLFGQRAQAQQVGVVSSWPSQAYVEARDASRAVFAAATAGLARAEWRDVNRGGDAEIVQAVSEAARHADLVILGQHEQGKSHLPEDLVAEVILHAGRPVLVLPYIFSGMSLGERPLIAWSDTREAARALHDALPLIAASGNAKVLAVGQNHDAVQASCHEVEAELAMHGITAVCNIGVVESVGVMDLLLNAVTDHSADLLVMGAKGGSGIPFESRGTGTRHILRHMIVPVLMSN